MSKDFRKHFSTVARSVAYNPIRAVALKAEVSGRTDIVSLGEGRPCDQLFPVGAEFSFVYRQIQAGLIPSEDEETSEVVHITSNRNLTLNYNTCTFSSGLPSLVSLAKKLLIDEHHNLQGKYWENCGVMASNGSTDAISKAVLLLTNPKDVIFCAEFSYSGLSSAAKPFGKHICSVKMDEDGIDPVMLERSCETISASDLNLRPKLLYVVPNGQNPTGAMIPESRRRELYEICCQRDMIIVVDDPYAFIQVGDESEKVKEKSFIEIESEFLNSNPSAMARVVRLDSFSKIVAPGFRLGIVTAPKEYINKCAQFTQVTSWGLSGPNQVIMEGLLNHIEKKLGFKLYLKNLQNLYSQRRACLINCLKKNVRQDLLEYKIPTHGMFIWAKAVRSNNSIELLDDLLANGVNAMPGTVFSPTQKTTNFVRISFSLSTEEEYMRATERLGEALEKASQTNGHTFEQQPVDLLGEFLEEVRTSN